jgi:drug/metabolite transporter (DMT)-like permease
MITERNTLEERAVGVALPERDDSAPLERERLFAVRQPSNRAKVLLVMFFAVVFGAFGDVSLSRGMKAVGAISHGGLVGTLVAVFTNLYVVGGILLLIAFLFLYLASLSWESLSFVLPLTAADYVLVTLLAYFLLGENVSPIRWVGSIMVAVGIALVART